MSKFYVTTAIIYANAKPHIGNALDFVQGDVLARYHKILGDEVRYSTGMDENGLTNYRAAQQAGKDPQQYVDEMAEHDQRFMRLYEVDYTDFVRTTASWHREASQAIWRAVARSGDIYKKSYKAIYCVGHEAFLTQSELIGGRCPEHPNLEPEMVEEENYFFRLSKYQKRLLDFYKKNPDFVVPSERYDELIKFVDKGLEDISISRPVEKLPWGIPVPDDPTHVMYVWFDALTNYISVIGYGQPGREEEFAKWWPADVHVIGKNIVRFHGAIWPAMLFSAGLELPKKVMTHGFITVGGQKMSKTLGNVIDPVEVAGQYGAEAARAFLLSEIPTLSDADVTWERIDAFYNGVLVDGLGNLLQRTLTLVNNAHYKPKLGAKPSCADVFKHIEEYQFHEACRAVWTMVANANQQIDKEKPWELVRTTEDGRRRTDRRQQLLKTLLSLYRQLETIGTALAPLVPGLSQRILRQLETLEAKPLFPRKV
jgi:methionyl-tRNA synthetase